MCQMPTETSARSKEISLIGFIKYKDLNDCLKLYQKD